MATGYLSRAENRKRYRIKNTSNGKCIRCSKDVVEGRKTCEYHLEYNRKQTIKNKAKHT